MKWLWLALVLVQPTAAYAGKSCSGGSSDGGSSSSGNSSSGSSGYTTAGDAADRPSSSQPACIDDSDVVGYRHCTQFGMWARTMVLPRLFVELGSNVRQLTSMRGAHNGTVQHGAESFSYRVVMPTADPARDIALTHAFRIGAGLSRRTYAGVEFEIGGLVAPAAATAEMTSAGTFGSPSLEQGHGLVIGALGIAGFRGTAGRGSLALEGAGGVRSVRHSFASSYHDCESSTTIEVTSAVVEARARGELWLGPWFTAGAVLGASVVDRGDWMAGVYLGIHNRAFGGTR